MYKIWRKITKNLAYMQEMSSRNVVFCTKNSLEWGVRGRIDIYLAMLPSVVMRYL
jgi:hypothetical protein